MKTDFAIRITGLSVDQIRIDHAVTLVSYDKDSVGHLVRLGVPFRFHDGRKEREINPERPEELEPLLPLLHRTISICLVNDEGELQITVTGGPQLTVAPHPKVVAWTYTCQATTIACCPGGGVEFWSEERR